MSVRVLRILVTIYLALGIGQAGLGAGFLDDRPDLLVLHNINAYLVVGMGIACLVGGILYQRDGGPWWPAIFAGVMVVVSIAQAVLGQTGVRGPHVFLGVLFLCGITTLCSYVWRHRPPETVQTPSTRRSPTPSAG